jgi:hypothetical protein
MKTLRSTLAILILMLILSMATFAQDTPEPAPTVEAPAEATVIVEVPVEVPVPVEDVTVDSNIVVLISMISSIFAVTVIAGVSVFRSGGTAQAAIKAGAEKGVRSLISSEGLSGTVENRLLAIPQAQRNWLMELVNLASPITDTSTISKDAAQWIKNVLDGNALTGAIPFTASSTSESFIQAAVTPTPNKSDSAPVG